MTGRCIKQKLILPAILLAASSAFSATYYVNAARPNDTGAATSWATAKKTIQAAVNLAKNGDTVRVTNGTYVLSAEISVTNAITIQSVNGPGVTIVDGNNSNRCFNLTGACSVRAFTIQNGSVPFEHDGGGILCSSANSVVSDCLIVSNGLDGIYWAWCNYGGGMSGGTARDCIFRANKAEHGGGAASTVAMNCIFEQNYTDGISGTFGWDFGDGGGMYGGEAYGCTFIGNSSFDGGGIIYVTAYDCLFKNNSATYSGGGSFNSATINCTFTGNSANFSGGASCGGIARNCIFSRNVAGRPNYTIPESSADYTDTTIYNSCSSYLTHGVNGNITNAPLFVDVANGDFRLQSNSPCINMGDNSAVSNATDLAGNSRIVDGTVDMGAYEYNAALCQITTIAGPNGTITPFNPDAIRGSNKTLSIQPEIGYRTESLAVDGVPVDIVSSYTFTNVQTAHTVAASFVAALYPLTVENGSGDGAYTMWTVTPITADERAGKLFVRWSGATQYVANVTSSTTTVTMPAQAVSLTAMYVADITKPTLAFELPTIGLRVTNALYTVRGRATDNKAVTNVLVQLNGGAWVTANTTNGWKNWSLPVTLAPGINILHAYSTDIAQNNSPIFFDVCTYVVYGALSVQTNGPGIATLNPVEAPEVGKPYTLTATPRSGCRFVNWTGDVTGASPVITFVMTSNMTVTANFADIQRPTVAITAPTAAQRIDWQDPRFPPQWIMPYKPWPWPWIGQFVVLGKALDNRAVASVWVQINSNNWMQAAGTNTWHAQVLLAAGPNTIRAYSVDMAGNCSPTSSVICTYVVFGSLMIQTKGIGTVTRTPATTPEVGAKYTMTATPGAGYGFKEWTGALVSTNRVESFVMPMDPFLGIRRPGVTITANFIDIQKPTVAITSPTASQRVMTNGTVILRGTAADNSGLNGVKYQLRTGEWTNAVSTNVWKNWTAEYIPESGLNTAKVYSVDVQGNISATSTVVFTYAPGAVMQVQTNGVGTVTPSYNGRVLEIGKSYTMTATARSGYLFNRWTFGLGGELATNKPAITFKMTSNLVLTANFSDPRKMPAVEATPYAEIIVDGSTADWIYVPRTAFSYASVTQEVAAALSGNNIALLLSGCPFSTSDTALVYFKLRLSYGDASGLHTVDLWTSGSVLYGMIDGQVITGFEAVLLNGVLEVKFPVEQVPSQVIIEEVGCAIGAGDGTMTELFRLVPPAVSAR